MPYGRGSPLSGERSPGGFGPAWGGGPFRTDGGSGGGLCSPGGSFGGGGGVSPGEGRTLGSDGGGGYGGGGAGGGSAKVSRSTLCSSFLIVQTIPKVCNH